MMQFHSGGWVSRAARGARICCMLQGSGAIYETGRLSRDGQRSSLSWGSWRRGRGGRTVTLTGCSGSWLRRSDFGPWDLGTLDILTSVVLLTEEVGLQPPL